MKPEQYAGYTPEEPEHGGSYHQTEPSSVYVERRQLAADAVKLQWKVTAASSVKIDIAEGKVYTQSGFTGTTAAEVLGTTVSASGFAICTITRNSASRAITGAVNSYATGTLAASTETTQIIPLAQIVFTSGTIEKIIQLQFEELRISENFAVENGQFVVADFRISSRKTYAPAAP